jgi:hypothetical protein
MKDYKILVAIDVPGLEDKVKELLAKGWEPLGGVAVKPFDTMHGRCLYQAMVKNG